MNSEISPTETRVTRSLRKRLNSTDSELSVDFTPQKSVPIKSQLDPISENEESAKLKKVTRNIDIVATNTNTPARRVTRRSSDALDISLALTPTPARRTRGRKSLVISEESSDSVTPAISSATSIPLKAPSTPTPTVIITTASKRPRRSIAIDSTVVEEDEPSPTKQNTEVMVAAVEILPSSQTPSPNLINSLKPTESIVVLTRQKIIEDEIKLKSPHLEQSLTTRSQSNVSLNNSSGSIKLLNKTPTKSPQNNKTGTTSTLSTSLTSQKNTPTKSTVKSNESINNDGKKPDVDDDDDDNSSFVSLVFEFESDGDENDKNNKKNDTNKSVINESTEKNTPNDEVINHDSDANANMSIASNDLNNIKTTNYMSKSFSGIFSKRTSIISKQLSKSLTNDELNETSSLDTTLDSFNQSGTNNSSGNVSSSQQVTETDELSTTEKDDDNKNNISMESVEIPDQEEQEEKHIDESINKSSSSSAASPLSSQEEQEPISSQHEESFKILNKKNDNSIINKSNTSISGNSVEKRQSLDETLEFNVSVHNYGDNQQKNDKIEKDLLNSSKTKQRKLSLSSDLSLSKNKNEINDEKLVSNNEADDELNKSIEKKKKRSLSLSKSFNGNSLVAIDSGVYEPSSPLPSQPLTTTTSLSSPSSTKPTNLSIIEQAEPTRTTTLTNAIPTDSPKNDVTVKKPRVSFNSVINRCDDLLNQLNEEKRQQKMLNKPEIDEEKIEKIKDKKKHKQMERARREAAILEQQRLEKEKKLKKRLKKEIKQTAVAAAAAAAAETAAKEIATTNTSTKDDVTTTPSSYEETSVIHALKHAVRMVGGTDPTDASTNKKTQSNTQEKNKKHKHKIVDDIDNATTISAATAYKEIKSHQHSEPKQKKTKTVIGEFDDQTPFGINGGGQQIPVIPKKLIMSSGESSNPMKQALTAAASITTNKKKKKLSVLDTVKELEKQKQTELTTGPIKKQSKKSTATNSTEKVNPFAKQQQKSLKQNKEKGGDQQNVVSTSTVTTTTAITTADPLATQKSKKASFIEQIRANLKSKPSSSTLTGGVQQTSKKLKKKIEFVERVKQLPKPQWTTAGEFNVSDTSINENIYSEGSTTFTVTTLNTINKKNKNKMHHSNSLKTLTTQQSNIINSGGLNFKQNAMFDGRIKRES